MTRKEAERQTHQADTLRALGFTRDEAEALRRISLTLHRWHEMECGTDRLCIVRGHMIDGKFAYADDGSPFYEFANFTGRYRYAPIADREKGALRRLAAIVNRRNARIATPDEVNIHASCVAKLTGHLSTYIQTDPRGVALYLIRPSDMPEGADVSAYYSRGICVY